MDTLTQSGIKWKTDKVQHGFTHFYNSILIEHQNNIKNILEIGSLHPESHKIWSDYFQDANVQVIPTKISEKKTWIAAIKQIKKIDLIIDDASHNMDDQQKALSYFFKNISPGGYYIIEDLHTSTLQYTNDNNFNRNTDSSNTTLKMLMNYLETGKIKSIYMDIEDCNYLENYIEECFVYRKSQLSGNKKASMSVILKKKGILVGMNSMTPEELKNKQEEYGIKNYDINVVTSQTKVDSEKALHALIKTKNNLVDAIIIIGEMINANRIPNMFSNKAKIEEVPNSNVKITEIPVTDSDIKIVMEQASVEHSKAKEALMQTNNSIVDAIMKLTM